MRLARHFLSLVLTASTLALVPLTSNANEVKAVIYGNQDGGKISRHIYGHFAEHLGRCIYDGIWVGDDSPIPNTRGMRNDIIEALKAIDIPNLRWPGGCFADDYHWRDGIGPRARASATVNIHWGQVDRDNAFGTHEFLDLCELLGAEPYIAGNVGSGTPRGDARLDRIHDVRRRQRTGQLASRQRPRETVEDQVLRRRQRELGLRRKHAARSTTPTSIAASPPSAAISAAIG